MAQSILNNDVKFIQKRMNEISKQKKVHGTQIKKLKIRTDGLDAEKKILQEMLALDEKYKHFKDDGKHT